MSENKTLTSSKNGPSDFGGVLAIIVSVMCILLGLMIMRNLVVNYSFQYYASDNSYLFGIVLVGVFAIVAFYFGLTGGIMALRKQNFALSVVGTCFPVTESLVILDVLFTHEHAESIGLAFVFPLLFLSAASLIFVAISYHDLS